MARTAAAGFWSQARACVRTVQHCLGAPSWLAAGLILIGLTFSGACRADPVKGEATFSASGGYARLVLKLADDVESEVTTAGSILVIRFKRPVDIPVDKLSDAVPDYVGSARRDPGASSVLNDQKLTIMFSAMLTFDLADAKVAAPSNIASINQKIEGDQSAVEVALIGDVDVHSFREEKNYIIDVAFQQPEKPSARPSPAAEAPHAPVSTAPVSTAPAAPEKPADAAVPRQSG